MGKRAEMRREKHKKDPCRMYTDSEIQKIKEDAIREATNRAFLMFLAFPVYIVREKFSLIMRRAGREETMIELLLDLYDSYDRDYVSITDIREYLNEYAGCDVVEIAEKRRGRKNENN